MSRSSQRLRSLPKYLFAELEEIREQARREMGGIFDLSIGDPDLPTPEPVVQALKRAIGDAATHRYPEGRGSSRFREAAARWFERRFGVELDPDREVLCLIGAKEGLAHLPLAVCDPGDLVLVPDPGYPVYGSAAVLADARPYRVALDEGDGYLMDIEGAWQSAGGGVRLCYINYPHNPTGAVADLGYYGRAVAVAGDCGFLLCCDAAYSEITYGGVSSPSVLEVDGAREVAVEFHSLSKTFNMTGWRIGFAVGNPDALRCLAEVKSNVDSGAFGAVQEAAVEALEMPESELRGRCEVYERRRDLVVESLRQMGCRAFVPGGAFYVWAKVPRGLDSFAFASELLRRVGVVVTPGVGFGRAGEGYFRIALTVPEETLRAALDRMAELRLWGTEEA